MKKLIIEEKEKTYEYKEGGTVKIKSDLEIGNFYGGLYFNPERAEYSGKEVIIDVIDLDPHLFFIKGTGTLFRKDMIEPC